MVQLILSVAIRIIQTLPDDFNRDQEREKEKEKEDTGEKKNEQEKSEKDDKSDIKKDEDENSEKEDKAADTDDESEDPERWIMDEKEKLLHFITKIFLMNFPSYIAHKHIVHSSLEVSYLFIYFVEVIFVIYVFFFLNLILCTPQVSSLGEFSCKCFFFRNITPFVNSLIRIS